MTEFGGQGEKAGITEKIETYREDIETLVKFLPWLEAKNRQNISSSYLPEGAEGAHAFHVPVYDSTLLNFVKVFQQTKFMNRNYIYLYHRKRIKTAEDELKVIADTQIMEIETLGDILSNYVIRGMSKSVMWNDGVSKGIFYAAVSRMKELLEFWTKPM